MERFNYPSLAALRRESVELLYLLECESYGEKRIQRDELERRQAEIESRMAE
jgi:hypothetical protein